MKSPDNHVSISVGMVHEMSRVLNNLDNLDMEPDAVTIEQSDIALHGSFNLVYDCPVQEETRE